MSHDQRLYDEKELVYQKTPLEKLNRLYAERVVKNIQDFKDEPFFIYFAAAGQVPNVVLIS